MTVRELSQLYYLRREIERHQSTLRMNRGKKYHPKTTVGTVGNRGLPWVGWQFHKDR